MIPRELSFNNTNKGALKSSCWFASDIKIPNNNNNIIKANPITTANQLLIDCIRPTTGKGRREEKTNAT